MSLIDGVGDEVTEFFLIATVICIALGAWYSTAINHRLRIRTVLIFEHRTNIPANSTTPSIENTVPPVVSSQPSSPNRMINHRTVTADVDSEGSVEEEQDVIVQTMDSETNKIRQRQIAYVDEGATNAECSEAGGEGVNISSIDSEESIKVKDNSCGEKSDETNDTLEANKICKSEEAPEVEIKPESSQSKVGSEKMADENLIHIKLKYLNDDIKHVEGLKGEKLGEFKRRHFSMEIANCKVVRLIFNGQVLIQDGETLEDCGLFNNCVVHCLIHQRPAASAQPLNDSASNAYSPRNIFTDTIPATFIRNNIASNGTGSGRNSDRGESILPWDLGNVLLVLISLVLCGAWYFRFEYAQLFTVTATVFLMCLTGIFTLLLVGILYPDSSNAVPTTPATATTTTTTTS